MVDVSDKPETKRMARAKGSIRMEKGTLLAIQSNSLSKGDVVTVARIAGIQGAKRTAELIPLCHSLPLSDVQLDVVVDEELPGLHVEATARTTGRTGVEMEAIVAVSIALATIYDMAKAMDRGMVITEIALIEKTGGRSGSWLRE
jgi:cyclic pyranopterin monophosphate synthase